MTRSTLRLVAAAALLAAGQAAIAADTQQLNITASITPTCKMQAIPAMNVTLNPVALGDGSGSTTVSYRCTKGTSGTLTFGTQTNGATGTSVTLNGPASETMPIKLTWAAGTSGSGGLSGTANTVNVTGTILQADWENKTAGDYNGNIQVTISP